MKKRRRIPWNSGLTVADHRVARAEARRRASRVYTSKYATPGPSARNDAYTARRRFLDPLGLRVREGIARGRARRAGRHVEPVDYLLVIARDDFVCGICGVDVTPADLGFDHRIPMCDGGPHTLDNVRVVHQSCNERKGEAESREARLAAMRAHMAA